jgi:hypothetical protein
VPQGVRPKAIDTIETGAQRMRAHKLLCCIAGLGSAIGRFVTLVTLQVGSLR